MVNVMVGCLAGDWWVGGAAAVVMGSNTTRNGIPSGFGTASGLEGNILPVEVPFPVRSEAECLYISRADRGLALV